MTATSYLNYDEENGGRTAKKRIAFTSGAMAEALAQATSNTRVKGVPLGELRKVAAMKDALGDAGDNTALGVADTAGSPLLGSTSNNSSKSEVAGYDFVMPQDYVAGQDFTVRARAKVSATRFVGATVDLTAKLVGDSLGADICATNAQTLTTSYAAYDFTVTGAGINPGDTVNLQFLLSSNDTGGSTNGASSATQLTVRYPAKN